MWRNERGRGEGREEKGEEKEGERRGRTEGGQRETRVGESEKGEGGKKVARGREVQCNRSSNAWQWVLGWVNLTHSRANQARAQET